jgi:hypothetical protein
MGNVPISKLPIETLQQLEAQCADVIAEICRSLSCNSDFVDTDWENFRVRAPCPI